MVLKHQSVGLCLVAILALTAGSTFAQIAITVHMTDGTPDTDFSDGTGHYVGALALQDATHNLQHAYTDGAPWPNRNGSTVTILDSGHYVGGILNGNILDYTIQAAAGQTPTIEGHIWAQTIVLGHDYAGVYTGASMSLLGAADDARITLMGSQAAPHYALHTVWGGDGAGAQGMVVENVDFYPGINPEGDSANGHPVQSVAGQQGTYTFTNVSFHMANTATAGNNRQNGPWLNGGVTSPYFFNNCEFISEGFWTFGAFEPTLEITFNDTYFVGQGMNIGSIIDFNRCTFGPGAHVLRHDAWGATPVNATYTECVFNSRSDIFVGLESGSLTFNKCDIVCDPEFNGYGADFDGDGTADGTPAPEGNAASFGIVFRVHGGDITFNDCTGTGSGVYGWMDSWGDPGNAAHDLKSDITVNMNRCHWMGRRAGEVGGAAGGGEGFTTTYNLTNTIYNGEARGMTYSTNGPVHAGHLISMGARGDASSAPGVATLNANHCTFAGNTWNAFFFGDGGRGDAVNLENSIVYTNQITASHALSAIAVNKTGENITYVDAADDGSGSPFQGDPNMGGLAIDPLLDATGHLTAASPAIDAAVDSTLDIDIDNDPRPFPANGAADIGADEDMNIIFTPQLQGEIAAGADFMLFVDTTAFTGDLTFQWYKNGTLIDGATASALDFTEASSSDVGTYTCAVTDDFGTFTSRGYIVGQNNFIEVPAVGVVGLGLLVGLLGLGGAAASRKRK